ncbi:unnamed protein product [Angiostrongylus costaricensis]|uniref:Uncharacterized protein n=1 Tax=Angiostrongylus costaricensis TaxID=334426 RepID=A0A0R3PYY5_ANGCS|nr:unnamed protein product [Angiostrongylus costaricensis]
MYYLEGASITFIGSDNDVLVRNIYQRQFCGAATVILPFESSAEALADSCVRSSLEGGGGIFEEGEREVEVVGAGEGEVVEAEEVEVVGTGEDEVVGAGEVEVVGEGECEVFEKRRREALGEAEGAFFAEGGGDFFLGVIVFLFFMRFL